MDFIFSKAAKERDEALKKVAELEKELETLRSVNRNLEASNQLSWQKAAEREIKNRKLKVDLKEARKVSGQLKEERDNLIKKVRELGREKIDYLIKIDTLEKELDLAYSSNLDEEDTEDEESPTATEDTPT